MKLSNQRPEEVDVNITPMIDIVFLLLLFFMISTSFVRESSLKVDLPEATGEPTEQEQLTIDIVVFTDGTFSINDTVFDDLTHAKIADGLKKAAGKDADPHIIISADASAEYQHVVTIMDTSRQLGYNRLTLATRQPE